MPNRIIKDSLCRSDKVNAMTDFQFRVWVSLITYVDDYGRGDARPEIIKGTCFPLRAIDPKKIDAALKDLAKIGSIQIYTANGKRYLCFPNWRSHQTIRNAKSKFPAPPENAEISNGEQANTLESNCIQMISNVPVIQSNPNPNPNPNPIEAHECADRTPLDIALDDFAEARKAMKKPLGPKARELTIRELEKLAPGDEATQIAIINQSIQRGWQGVFPLKDEHKGPPMKTSYDGIRIAQGDDTDRLAERLGVGT